MFKTLRLILLPFSWLYGLIVEAIKFSYRQGWQTSRRFEVATIVVGNLSTGGTGKTPHVEYVVAHLKHYHKLAVLSRGYGRKTKGFRNVLPTDKANDSGDEPLQIAQKFPTVPVFVAEKRVEGILRIMRQQPQVQLVVLDDAMQHWPLRADCYMMLSTYEAPFFNDFVLPAGNLREFRFNYRRADIIIISKCPATISEADAQVFIQKLAPKPTQKVFFSYFKYGLPFCFNEPEKRLQWNELAEYHILMVTGIANPSPIVTELKSHNCSFELLSYVDHHRFELKDWHNIQKKLKSLETKTKKSLLLTTEKDATKLSAFIDDSVSLFVLAVEVEIAFGKAAFLQRALVEVMYKKKGYPTT